MDLLKEVGMKGKILTLNSLLAVMVLIVSGVIMTPVVCTAAPSKDELITVMNPGITETPYGIGCSVKALKCTSSTR